MLSGRVSRGSFAGAQDDTLEEAIRRIVQRAIRRMVEEAVRRGGTLPAKDHR